MRFVAERVPLWTLYAVHLPEVVAQLVQTYTHCMAYTQETRSHILTCPHSGTTLHGEQDERYWTPYVICQALALKKGFILGRGGRPDLHKAGVTIIQDCVLGYGEACIILL